MSVFNVNIKWGKELFKDVEVNIAEPPIVFKAQMYALSNVQPERQKIMVKGQIIGDTDWSNVSANLKDGLTLMMMGSVDPLLSAPVKQIQFMEDMTEAQLALALDLPVGLKNLGNTCYLNAVVQCLRAVPPLTAGLHSFRNTSGDMQGSLTLALRDTYEFMDKYKHNDYPPIMLVQLLRTVFPHFATTGEHGEPQQQDANECLTELLRILQQKLPAIYNGDDKTVQKRTSLIDQYMSGQVTCVMKCDEAPDEPAVTSYESFLQLSCFISQDTKYLNTGLKLKLEETLTKHSTTLGRDATYTRTSRISRLPAFLCVQLIRFFYKEKEKISAKILKDIKFPLMLDTFDLCSSECQEKLKPRRELFRLRDEKVAFEEKAAKRIHIVEPAQGDGIASQAKANQESQLNIRKTASTNPDDYTSYSFEDDEGSNNSGYYELLAVLTHKGRSSNSGHYVGWVKNQASGEWFKYDDENVSPVLEEEILKLSGGGDWHTAYVLFYGPRRLEKEYLTLKSESAESSTVIATTETANGNGTTTTTTN